MTKARHWLAAILLATWLVLLCVSTLTPALHTCDDSIARVGGAALVRSCRALSFTDAPVLAMLVIAGILLLPDLSVLEIPGVVRVERQLQEQVKRQEEIVAMVHRLEMAQHQQVNVYTAATDAAKAVEVAARLEEKRHIFESDA